MYSPNTTNLHYTNYVFNTSTSGCEIYDLDTESIIKYVTYSGGLNSVWSNEDYAYLATPDDGIYRLDLDYITSVTGMDLTSYLDVFKQYPDILDNEVKYIHGCGDYMCVVTASGVDHFNFGNSSSYTRSSGLVAAEKCFQTCRGRFYYTAGPKTVTIYTHQCDWSEGTEGYVYDSTSPGTLLPESAIVRDIFVVEGTSSYGQNNNLILVATSEGVTLIEERPGDEANSNYRIYLTPYVIPVGDRAVFGGGITTVNVNTLDYITISSTGNAVDFGDLTVSRRILCATSNGGYDRGVFAGGYVAANSNVIDFITISVIGNATDFGDLTEESQSLAATSNGANNRGVFGGGNITTGLGTININTVSYIAIHTTIDAVDFGDLTQARRVLTATSNTTNNRGVFGAGWDGTTNYNIMDYITISTPSNASDFGDLTPRRTLSAASNGTNNRGVFGGGYAAANSNVIDYITISSTGNATDFGDLTAAKYGLDATSNGTNNRGVFGGGYTTVNIDVIDYITVSSTGNAADFGDLTEARRNVAAVSNA